MRRLLFFEISHQFVRVLRLKSPAATFFHDVSEIPTETALEELGVLTHAEVEHRILGGPVGWPDPRIAEYKVWQAGLAKQLDRLTEQQQLDLIAWLAARKKGFNTAFLAELDEVK